MFNKPKRLNKKRQGKDSRWQSEKKAKAMLMELSGKWEMRPRVCAFCSGNSGGSFTSKNNDWRKGAGKVEKWEIV